MAIFFTRHNAGKLCRWIDSAPTERKFFPQEQESRSDQCLLMSIRQNIRTVPLANVNINVPANIPIIRLNVAPVMVAHIHGSFQLQQHFLRFTSEMTLDMISVDSHIRACLKCRSEGTKKINLAALDRENKAGMMMDAQRAFQIGRASCRERV